MSEPEIQSRCRIEYRLVRVRGDQRMVYARGSEKYVEEAFTDSAALTVPVALAARLRQQPTTWQVERVLIAEDVLTVTLKTAEEVEAAKAEVARRQANQH